MTAYQYCLLIKYKLANVVKYMHKRMVIRWQIKCAEIRCETPPHLKNGRVLLPEDNKGGAGLGLRGKLDEASLIDREGRFYGLREGGTHGLRGAEGGVYGLGSGEEGASLAKGTHSLRVGEAVTFRCEAGYELDGVERLDCLEDGTWSDIPPVCQPVPCTQPPQ
jgi:Sushi repeat (SCR repeat)